MKATAFEFRFRVVLMVATIALGFYAPWIEAFRLGTRTTTWLWLGFELGSVGMTATAGIQLVTVAMILIAAAAAAIRVWGTAYLGIGTVNNAEMIAGTEAHAGVDSLLGSEVLASAVMASGPYRFVRNPLYIGSWLMVLAIAALMPPSGTAVTMLLLTIFLFRLILAEEAFLTAKLGKPYEAYRRAVPRLLPQLLPRLVPKSGGPMVSSGQTPDWGRALLGEICPLGIFLSLAVLSWWYNAQMLIRAVLVSFGISLVVRALVPRSPEQPPV